MTSAWNVEKNVERSGRINVWGKTYYGVNWLQLLSENIRSDLNSTVLGLDLEPTQPSVHWVTGGGGGGGGGRSIFAIFSGINSTKECYLQTSIGRCRGFMLSFLCKCSVVSYYIYIEFWHAPWKGCMAANFDTFDRTACKSWTNHELYLNRDKKLSS